MAEWPTVTPEDDGRQPEAFQATPDYPETSPATPEAARAAMQGFMRHLNENEEYAAAPEYKRWKLRPELAQDYVRSVVIKNNPGIENVRPSKLFDPVTVRQNIGRIQDDYGPKPQENDEFLFRRRFDHLSQYMSLAAAVGSRRLEYVVANFLASNFHTANDVENADSLALLIAAYGRTLERIVRPIGSNAAQQYRYRIP